MKFYLKRGAMLGFVIALGIIGVLGVYSYLSIQKLIKTATALSHSLRVTNGAEKLLVTAIDMETGQRGFVITGNEIFLQPYDSAIRNIETDLQRLNNLTEDYPDQHEKATALALLVHNKIQLVANVVAARRESFEKARDIIANGEGKKAMDDIRRKVAEIKQAERSAFNSQNQITDRRLTQFQYGFLGLLIIPAVIIIVLLYYVNAHLNERERFERHLQKASQDISQLNSDLEGFTYSVSHDLRAPLRSINGYAQILKEDYSSGLDEEGNRVIDVITRNAQRMGQLIDDLLDFSRLGRKEISKTKVNIEDMVKGINAEILEQQKNARTKIDVLVLETVSADASMIRQVWFNLISNAIKYSGKRDEPKVEIGSFSDKDQICYYVKDNGVGFNMEYVGKLFGVFQRLHKLDEFEGTGVGLALVKRIVTRHGGKVWAEARINEGATFFFSIPK